MAGASLLATAAAPVGAATDRTRSIHTPAPVERLAGPTRIETAVEVSKDAFASATTAVIARSDVYADALAGGPLAADNDAPILLAGRDAAAQIVLDELERLGVTDIVLLGGAGALSEQLVTQLEGEGYDVSRIGGADRFATAAMIAADLTPDGSDTVFVVEGVDPDPNRGFPDAVSAAPYAAFVGAPILLVSTDTVPQPTMDALASLAPSEAVIVGGPAAVNEDVATSIETDDLSVRRLSGATRYETSAAVYDEAVTIGMDPAERWLATGRAFPDALTAAPAVAKLGVTLLLVDGPLGLSATPTAIDRLNSAFDRLERVALLGGDAAISDEFGADVTAEITETPAASDFCLTVLHNNDGESQLVDAGTGIESFGGAARFTSLVRQQQAAAVAAQKDGCSELGVLTLSAGDSILAGPEFQASLDKGAPYYDSKVLDRVGYNAIDLGNHDFDFGPEVTRELIEGMDVETPYVSANLSFEAGSPLKPLADSGRIAPSVKLDVGGRSIGVIGLTTETLRAISSPGDETTINDDLRQAVQDQADALSNDEVDIIVLVSHLQGLDNDLELVPMLTGVDVVIAGGGGEVLATPGEMLVPGDETSIFGTYPLSADDSDGEAVPIVTTAGDYRYAGRLTVRFDAEGELLADDAVTRSSRMLRVADAALPGGTAPDPVVQSDVVDPVSDYLDNLATTVIGTSEVGLDGSRPNIRTQETNLGDLLTDSLVDAAKDRAGDGNSFDPGGTYVGIQNGGGIRNNNVIPAGDISLLETFNIAPFPNFVAGFQDVEIAKLKELLEHGYSDVEGANGRFSHISGMEVEVDLAQPVGSRVRTLTVDGTVVVENGSITAAGSATQVQLITIDFLARGGDGYPFPPADDANGYAAFGVTYQQSLRDFIEVNLGGTISSADYPEDSEGRRITINGAS